MASAPSPLAQLLGARIAVWNATHPKAPLDPRAVMGIAAHEGLGGGVGDNGTSYGAFQLHLGGAYPSFAPHGTPQQNEAWANSVPGIDYALNQIGSVAGGLRGLPAIQAISTRFERPANPQAEIQDAAAHYGLPLPQMTGVGAAAANSPNRAPQVQNQSPQSNLPPVGLLANLMGGGGQPFAPTPIDLTPSAPIAPLPTPLTPLQRIPFQPILAGGK